MILIHHFENFNYISPEFFVYKLILFIYSCANQFIFYMFGYICQII